MKSMKNPHDKAQLKHSDCFNNSCVNHYCLHCIALLCMLLPTQLFALGQVNTNVKLGGSVGINIGHDSNTLVEQTNNNTPAPSGTAQSSSDRFVKLQASGHGEYYFSNSHLVSGSLSINDKNYSKSHSFDLTTSLFSVGYKHKNDWLGKNYSLGIDYRQANARLNGNSYLSLSMLSPSFSYFLHRQHFIRSTYTYSQKQQENTPAKKATANEYGIDYYYFWNGLNTYLIGSVKVKQENAKDDELSYDGFQARIAHKKRYRLLSFKSQVTTSLKYRSRDYKDKINTKINQFRSDTQYNLGIRHQTTLIKSLNAEFEVNHLRNSSNLRALNYNETIVSVGAKYQF